MEASKSQWVNHLPAVLWGYRTTMWTTIDETPFNLTYGTEAMAPVEIGLPSAQAELFDPEQNHRSLLVNLDLLGEMRDEALQRMGEEKEFPIRRPRTKEIAPSQKGSYPWKAWPKLGRALHRKNSGLTREL